MNVSPNCDSCGSPLHGEALFMARRKGEFFFCPPCGAKREHRDALILGACVGVILLGLILTASVLFKRLGDVEERTGALESRARP